MYTRKSRGWKKHIDFMILDILVLMASFFIAFAIRHGSFELFSRSEYQHTLVVVVLASIIITIMCDDLKNVLKRGYLLELKATIFHNVAVICTVLVLLFVIKESSQIARLVVGMALGFSIVLDYSCRLLWKRFIISQLKTTRSSRKVLLVTPKESAEEMVEQITEHGIDFEMGGIVLTNANETTGKVKGIPVVCKVDDLIKYVIENVIDEVFFLDNGENEIPKHLIAKCQEMGVTTHQNLILPKLSREVAYIENFGGYSALTYAMKVASPRQVFLKRVIDILGGIAGCILTGLLSLYVIPKIKKVDPGPAFFTQTRVGMHGREFKIYKFRSMYLDAEARKAELMAQNEMDGAMFKMKNDPRILPGIGEFIRKTSIDEFPQFFNVLKGDMSLCGTRPPLPSEVEQYDLRHYQRLAVKPGITGLWQVSGRSDITDFDEIASLDAQYIRDWSIKEDIIILLKTVMVVLKHEGAE